jgi:putative DNA-binding protein/CoA binding protein
MSKDATQSGGTGETKLSRATVGRLSLYLRQLESLASAGVETVSSSQLGEELDLTDAQVRRDFAGLGSLGSPGIGYHPPKLIEEIRKKLGLDRQWSVVLVGAGNLARALLRYRGFRAQGFHVVGVFDSDPASGSTTWRSHRPTGWRLLWPTAGLNSASSRSPPRRRSQLLTPSSPPAFTASSTLRQRSFAFLHR